MFTELKNVKDFDHSPSGSSTNINAINTSKRVSSRTPKHVFFHELAPWQRDDEHIRSGYR